jgi:Uma2 family endonuclease
MTLQEYRLLPEDNRLWELVDGELTMTPAPTTMHQRISARLLNELMTQLTRTGLAEVMHAPVDVVIDESNVVEPDLVVVSTARMAIVTERSIEGPPDVLVEILSPSSISRDRRLKFGLYARFGVREYWIVDPSKASVEAYRLADDRYALREQYGRTSTLRCPDFPTLEVSLSAVFP